MKGKDHNSNNNNNYSRVRCIPKRRAANTRAVVLLMSLSPSLSPSFTRVRLCRQKLATPNCYNTKEAHHNNWESPVFVTIIMCM